MEPHLLSDINYLRDLATRLRRVAPKCGGASEPVPEKPVARSADTYPNQYVDLSDPVAVRARTLKGLSGGDV